MGRLLNVNLRNTGLHQAVGVALSELGFDLEELCEEEHDMGLGNGGLGRLAACFLDSMATMDLPAIGYGIHYQFGLFRQEFENGRQVERPDDWLKYGNPWEIVRPQYAQKVFLYGRVEHSYDDLGDYRPQWVETKQVEGIPYDLTIVGYGARTVNFLRLWEAKASEQLDLQVFNQGGYVEAVREKAMGESISKVLYPNDETESGKELRLVQQYFFVACSLQDMISRFRRTEEDWNLFPEKVVVQLNDTHPAVAILELMRIFLDVECMAWERAWGLVRKTFAYTNHTLLPEALKHGGKACSKRSCPGICKSFGKSTGGSWPRNWPPDGPKTWKRQMHCPLLPTVRFGWLFSRWWAVIRSMASRLCTRNCSKIDCLRILRICIPKNSTTRPTELPPGVGCWVATPSLPSWSLRWWARNGLPI